MLAIEFPYTVNALRGGHWFGFIIVQYYNISKIDICECSAACAVRYLSLALVTSVLFSWWTLKISQEYRVTIIISLA